MLRKCDETDESEVKPTETDNSYVRSDEILNTGNLAFF